MVGRSPALEKVWDAVRRAAPTNATVLITGESGTGKELVARAIHRNSLRRTRPSSQVNCAAIPEDLIESELFGHEKGSFTGATEKHIGKFELANDGTIFLDEVGDMSLRTQAKVLRVLQEGEIVAGRRAETIKVDVRVIAATNKELEAAIERAGFREDLYFRLKVVPIRMPPLRERPEDVQPLVEHFVKQFCAENNFRPKTLTPGALDALRHHPWRGNVRELKNTVERLLIMVEGDEIRPEHLGEVLRSPASGPSPSRPSRPAATLNDFKGAPNAPSSSRSCATTAGTSPRPPLRSAPPARTSTRSSRSTVSARRRTGNGRGRRRASASPVDLVGLAGGPPPARVIAALSAPRERGRPARRTLGWCQPAVQGTDAKDPFCEPENGVGELSPPGEDH